MNIFNYKTLSFEHKLSDAPKDIYFPKHMHNEWEIYYFINGDANFIVGDNMFNLEENDLMLIRPTVFHRVKLNSNTSYERLVIDFPENYISKDILKIANSLPVKFHIKDDSHVESYLMNVKSLLDNSNITKTVFAISKTIELVILCLSQHQEQSAAVNNLFNNTFSKIIRFIDDNITKSLSIEDISKNFFVSESWVSHVFKKNLGISCTKYINMKRILYAQKLIKSGMAPTEAAIICTYNDYSTFFRQYKKFLDINPEEDKNIK